MKNVGALQPHRADSCYWNDSFGGHTNNTNSSTFSNCNSSSNRNRNNNYTFSNSQYKSSEINNICSESSKELAQPATVGQTNGKRRRVVASPDSQVLETVGLCGKRDETLDNGEKYTKNVHTRRGPGANGVEFAGLLDMIFVVGRLSLLNMMRGQQSLDVFVSQSSKLLSSFSFNERPRKFRFSAARSCFPVLLILLCVFTNGALCDETENVESSLGPEFTTLSLSTAPTIPPFDNATRGNKKFGDRCEDTVECGFPGSICDPRKKSCQCIEDLPVTNHLDKCGKEAAINESCFFNEQCEAFHFQTECRDQRCVCRFEMSPVVNKDGNVECKGKQIRPDEPERYVDPAMIGVLVGMALMFIIICVVLRLFSRARWHENRTIFNTPNPRLMNVSLLRDNKLMHGQERRGSRMSVRAPSRQPSMASLRPHSPNPSLGKAAGSRPGSRGSSNASAISTRSALAAAANHADSKVNSTTVPATDTNQTLIITNIIENPAAESVAIEILQPKSDKN